MNNPDHISQSLETIFWVKILKFFDADSEFGVEKNSDPEKFGSGINIPDPQHWLTAECSGSVGNFFVMDSS